MKTLKLLVTGTLAALTISSCAEGQNESQDEELTDVTVAITTANLAQKEDVAVFAVGEQLGYYEEEGITISTVTADGSSAAVQAVASGSADVSTPDAGSILGAVETGVPVTGIGGLVQNWPWSIGVPMDSDIEEPADLDNQNIGVISLASGSAPYARAFVESAGLDPENDVNLLPVGVGAQAMSAINGGDVEALALFGQAYTSIEQGGLELRYLDNPAEFDGLRSLTFMTTNQALSDDSELWEGFLRASYKALSFSATNPEAAVRLGYEEFPQLLGGEDPEDIIERDVELLTTWVESAIPEEVTVGTSQVGEATSWGAISDESWQITQEFSMDAGQISQELSLEDFWSPSLLDGANDFDVSAVIEEAENFER